MCSRYSLTSPPEAVRSYFRHQTAHNFPPRYNIAPTQPVAIVRTAPSGDRDLHLVRWGLLPPWVKDPSAFTTLINARAETAHEKPSFRGAFRHKRCLVPADGFYEWVGPAGAKRPHLIRPRARGLMAFAGLHESWLGADGSEIDTMAILTVAANSTVSVIHDRMPAILAPAQFDAWMDCRSVDLKEASTMLVPAADDLLDVVEVDPRLNNPRHEGAELQQPRSELRLL
jgi:putative SOS response-associated peptidase YedK